MPYTPSDYVESGRQVERERLRQEVRDDPDLSDMVKRVMEEFRQRLAERERRRGRR
jgi:hypothetical protein